MEFYLEFRSSTNTMLSTNKKGARCREKEEKEVLRVPQTLLPFEQKSRATATPKTANNPNPGSNVRSVLPTFWSFPACARCTASHAMPSTFSFSQLSIWPTTHHLLPKPLPVPLPFVGGGGGWVRALPIPYLWRSNYLLLGENQICCAIRQVSSLGDKRFQVVLMKEATYVSSVELFQCIRYPMRPSISTNQEWISPLCLQLTNVLLEEHHQLVNHNLCFANPRIKLGSLLIFLFILLLLYNIVKYCLIDSLCLTGSSNSSLRVVIKCV